MYFVYDMYPPKAFVPFFLVSTTILKNTVTNTVA